MLVEVIEFQMSYSNLKRWCCESAALNILANLENSAVATGLEKVSFHSNSKERQCQRMLCTFYSYYCTIAVISHASKVMLKVLQARFQPYVNPDIQMFKLVLEKAEEPEIKLPTSAGSWKKQESFRKHLLLLYQLCQSLWLCGSPQTMENSERDGNNRPSDLPLEKSVYRSGSNS